jgi:hypothetical protein
MCRWKLWNDETIYETKSKSQHPKLVSFSFRQDKTIASTTQVASTDNERLLV